MADHAAAHHGVVTMSGARDLGIARVAIDKWLRSGRLQRAAPEVYRIAGSPDSWRQRVTIAVGSTAGWSSHRTAAALWGLDGIARPVPVEVLTAFHQRRRRTEWIVHESRRFSGVDLDEVGGIPATSVARTLLDLPAVVGPFVVQKALDDACRKWPEMLDIVVQRYVELACPGRRGMKLFRGLLNERLGRGVFVQSGFESSTVALVRQVGLPEPTLQHPVRDGDFRAFLDISWPAIRWAIECDSMAWHSGKRSHEWDRLRRRRLKQLGWDLVEVTYDDVTKRRQATGAQLRELYHARRRSLSVVPGQQ